MSVKRKFSRVLVFTYRLFFFLTLCCVSSVSMSCSVCIFLANFVHTFSCIFYTKDRTLLNANDWLVLGLFSPLDTFYLKNCHLWSTKELSQPDRVNSESANDYCQWLGRESVVSYSAELNSTWTRLAAKKQLAKADCLTTTALLHHPFASSLSAAYSTN